jgi:hypothetical protein
MAGEFTIAVALEGQLRLDDQPAFHAAVALARLAAEAIPLLNFPQHSTAAVLEAIRPPVRPGVAAAFSSKFSPFLGIGSLSVRRIWQELLRYQALQSTDAGGDGADQPTGEGCEWMRQELLWREFFLWSERRHGDAFHAPGGIQGRPPRGSPIGSASGPEQRQLGLSGRRGLRTPQLRGQSPAL